MSAQLPDRPAAKPQSLTSAIAEHVTTGMTIATGLVGSMVEALQVQAQYGLPAAASSFAVKVGLMLHGEIEISRLKNLAEELKTEVNRLRADVKLKGTLVDFADERNLREFFFRVGDVLEARDEQKAELLKRVALMGLIQCEDTEVEARNMRYAIKILEPEDIDLLRRMISSATPRLEPHVNQARMSVNAPTPVPTSEARLVAAGILSSSSLVVGRGYDVTSFGQKFFKLLIEVG